MSQTRLDKYNNDWYQIGAPKWKQILWYFTNVLFFQNTLNPISSLKVNLLRAFGAKVGRGVVIKPNVNIKYPWKLEIGNYVWIGEKVWIDNLAEVKIESHACISQDAMLLCGNHNYKKETFDLMVGKITVEQGAWIGAKSVVCPKVRVGSHAILTVGSVATTSLEAGWIYQGNPSKKIKERKIQ